jgi:predicted methyltransferase
MRRHVLWLVAVLGAAPAAAQFPAPSRPVASIVSPKWSDETSRDAAGEVDTVIARLGLGANSVVADIGAGNGYYTVRLAPHVRQVYAEDIVASYVSGLKTRVREARLQNVTVTLGDTNDPRLPVGAIDVVLMVHMYHEVSQPFALLAHIFPALKPGGRLVIIDVDKPTANHGTPRAVLDCELTAVGYHEDGVTAVNGAYLAVFTASALTPPGDIRERLVQGGCGTPSS